MQRHKVGVGGPTVLSALFLTGLREASHGTSARESNTSRSLTTTKKQGSVDATRRTYENILTEQQTAAKSLCSDEKRSLRSQIEMGTVSALSLSCWVTLDQ